MANKFIANLALPSATSTFKAIWALTRAMKAAGWTYKASSSGFGGSKDNGSVAANDKWGGNADPLLDDWATISPTLGYGAWIVLRGPTTHKVPIGGPSTGTFMRGEKITQATSGAEGELLGYLWDTVSVTGWLVIQTRTGTFDGTNVITGASSGATITPSSVPLAQIREMVFWRSNVDADKDTKGSIYYQCIETANQAGTLFISLTAAAGCTVTVAPGGGGTGNGFAATAGVGYYVCRGAITTPGDAQTVTHEYWFGANQTNYGKVQIAAVNATSSAGVSGDGSFWLVIGIPSINASACSGFAFMRLDNTEDGDVDPYAWIMPHATSDASSYLKHLGYSYNGNGWADNYNHMRAATASGPASFGTSTKRRGNAAGAVGAGYIGLEIGTLGVLSSNKYSWMVGITTTQAAVAERVGDHPGRPTNTSPIISEPIWLVSNIYTGEKIRKGSCRWLRAVQAGATYDTWNTLQGIQVCAVDATSLCPGLILTPWDGATVPLQA